MAPPAKPRGQYRNSHDDGPTPQRWIEAGERFAGGWVAPPTLRMDDLGHQAAAKHIAATHGGRSFGGGRYGDA